MKPIATIPITFIGVIVMIAGCTTVEPHVAPTMPAWADGYRPVTDQAGGRRASHIAPVVCGGVCD